MIIFLRTTTRKGWEMTTAQGMRSVAAGDALPESGESRASMRQAGLRAVYPLPSRCTTGERRHKKRQAQGVTGRRDGHQFLTRGGVTYDTAPEKVRHHDGSEPRCVPLIVSPLCPPGAVGIIGKNAKGLAGTCGAHHGNKPLMRNRRSLSVITAPGTLSHNRQRKRLGAAGAHKQAPSRERGSRSLSTY